jgi:hypothetical protein
LGCLTHQIEFVVISHADQMAVVFEQLLLDGVHQAGITRDVSGEHALPQGECGSGANALPAVMRERAKERHAQKQTE